MDDELYLTDLVSVSVLQELQDSFSELTGMAALVTDKTGKAVTNGSNFTNFCKKYTRESSVGLIRCMGCDKAGAELTLKTGEACSYHCHAGLMDFAAPIMVNGKMVGSFIGGQVLTEKPNYDKFRETALEIGVDPDDYVEAVREVKIVPREDVIRAAKFLAKMTGTLSYVAIQSNELYERNIEIARAAALKNDFLANMSHEIRTPMNAVIGLVDLALREEMSGTAKEYMYQIKNSAKNLLVIINDILDFSKIESGKLDIINVAYEPLSVVNDLAAIVNNRIGNKEIEFTMDVSPDMPQTIFGDNVRIHQILLNLLTNAVKFTQRGEVHLTLECVPDESGENTVMKVSIKDTGIGIKKDDMQKLFNSFQQVDSKRNRNIEGTGLGLAISRQLLHLMGGEIHVESKYGKGSNFFFELPQKIIDKQPSIQCVKKNLTVGILAENQYVKAQLIADLKRIDADYEILNDSVSAENMHYDYLIIEKIFYSESIMTILDNTPEMKCIVISTHDAIHDVTHPSATVVYKPVYALNLYNALGITDTSMTENKNELETFTFVAPEAKVLIVDDNKVNLMVAKGLIEPLKMFVDTAESAAEAIKLVGALKYDLIFMDHMMPDVDGVECTHIIRRMLPGYNDVPIIALTANAVGDAKEMLLKEGMNDFVAKPIEIREIVSKIRKWLPQDKIVPANEYVETTVQEAPEPSENINIEGLDTKSALSLLGSKELFFTVLEEYCRSIDRKSADIERYFRTGDIKNYTIEVHSLKSTSKQIGAFELSELAASLEAAGKDNRFGFISEKTKILLEMYRHYKEILMPLFPEIENETEEKNADSDITVAMLQEMTDALDNFDTLQIDEVVEKMNGYRYPENQAALFEKLRKYAEESDLEQCMNVVEEWKAVL